MLSIYFLVGWVCLLPLSSSQLKVDLITNETMVLYSSLFIPPYNSSFIDTTTTYYCSLNYLYTYWQSQDQLAQNTPYYLRLYNVEQRINVSTSTAYDIFSPTFNATFCDPGTTCTIEIKNNCPNPVNFFAYYDQINVHIDGLSKLSYNVICDQSFTTNTFEWGLLIEIVFCTILLPVVAVYSNAWSIGNKGISITVPMLVVFEIVIIIGGVVAYFSIETVNVAFQTLSWIFGSLAIGLCANELLYFLKIGFLKKGFSYKRFDFRIMEGISLLIGIGVCFGWWYSGKNWIINDIISVCMIVAGIKILKFTSMRIAVICYCATILLEMVFVLVINYGFDDSYNHTILNEVNNPFQLQIPTINAVYNQKCSWLPVSSILYPGVLMSYMRRFDSSRNTRVYLIICVAFFFIGSIVWMLISVFSSDSWPFGLIAEPMILAFIAFFAWKRKEIRTLWGGKFYDQQFTHKESLNQVSEMVARERKNTQIQYGKSLFSGLEVQEDESGFSFQPPATRRATEIAKV